VREQPQVVQQIGAVGDHVVDRVRDGLRVLELLLKVRRLRRVGVRLGRCLGCVEVGLAVCQLGRGLPWKTPYRSGSVAATPSLPVSSISSWTTLPAMPGFSVVIGAR